ncbi:MAG TPA: DUF305 domain-containing protein [Gemmatimonadaceae bacterium]|nr:DUF305 domain-containing protein [Gemmatimonadaceae bacterium]
MIRSHVRGASIAVALATAACSSATQGTARPSRQTAAPSPSDIAAIAKAQADSARRPYTEADIRFMSGMISHHAQAIKMAGWAPTRGAGSSVKILCERIINAQQDEIHSMQTWLRDRRQPVPEASANGMKMMMNGVEHTMLMPGMLTDAQMQQLDKARGTEFDRLFLTFMIQHHRGAIEMVKELFGSYGAGQDETVFKFASDVNVDQTTEIARMERMLAALTP